VGAMVDEKLGLNDPQRLATFTAGRGRP